jgi:hypothetical protein
MYDSACVTSSNSSVGAHALTSVLRSIQFAAGFFGVQAYSTSYHQLIEVEAPQINTTLAPYEQCPNANNAIAGYGTVQASKWLGLYTGSIVQRLQPFIDGVTLDATDIFAMQQLCAYEASRKTDVAPTSAVN